MATPTEAVWTDTLAGGDKTSFVLRRHHSLRLTDTGGGACVAMLAVNHADRLERYNMPDTLKAQFTAFLTAGRVLMGDMGRALLSVTHDDVGWHDTLGGFLDAEGLRAKLGHLATYQEARNAFHRNTRDNLLIELGKHGLGERDLHANVNWFCKVASDEAGVLRWHPQPRAGASVELRAECDVVIVLANTVHPLDPTPVWPPPTVQLAVHRVPPPGPDDPCRVSRAECGRAMALTERFVGGAP